MTRKSALVTGAGSGIGRAVALQLAQKKYRVFALGRTLSKVNETAALAGKDELIVPLCADVSQKDDLERALYPLLQVDVVVANAGICKRAKTASVEADDVWRRVIDTNLTGSWNTMRAVCEKLRPGARVVLVSSGLGKLGRAGYTAYAASKHGVLGIMKCLSLEWAKDKIGVNAVCPGWVDTEMALSDLQQSANTNGTSVEVEGQMATASIPLKRFVTATEVASLITWLCSSEAGAITGQACNISGGEFGV